MLFKQINNKPSIDFPRAKTQPFHPGSLGDLAQLRRAPRHPGRQGLPRQAASANRPGRFKKGSNESYCGIVVFCAVFGCLGSLGGENSLLFRIFEILNSGTSSSSKWQVTSHSLSFLLAASPKFLPL